MRKLEYGMHEAGQMRPVLKSYMSSLCMDARSKVLQRFSKTYGGSTGVTRVDEGSYWNGRGVES